MFDDAERRERREIDEDDRPEHRADLRRAARLHEEQADQDDDRDRDDQRLPGSPATTVSPSTAERTEIAGRDHRVAVEQARPRARRA